MKKYLIGASGLGDWWVYSIELVKTEEEASFLAWNLACEAYESGVGMNGIRDISDIMEDENCSEEDAQEIFKEDREMWIDYWTSSDVENKIQELLKKGYIDSVNEISNYENLCN
jgi:hypothetical protein